MLSDFNICSKPTVIEICDVRVKIEGQWNRIKKLEIDIWLVYFNKEVKSIYWRINSCFNL